MRGAAAPSSGVPAQLSEVRQLDLSAATRAGRPLGPATRRIASTRSSAQTYGLAKEGACQRANSLAAITLLGGSRACSAPSDGSICARAARTCRRRAWRRAARMRAKRLLQPRQSSICPPDVAASSRTYQRGDHVLAARRGCRRDLLAPRCGGRRPAHSSPLSYSYHAFISDRTRAGAGGRHQPAAGEIARSAKYGVGLNHLRSARAVQVSRTTWLAGRTRLGLGEGIVTTRRRYFAPPGTLRSGPWAGHGRAAAPGATSTCRKRPAAHPRERMRVRSAPGTARRAPTPAESPPEPAPSSFGSVSARSEHVERDRGALLPLRW